MSLISSSSLSIFILLQPPFCPSDIPNSGSYKHQCRVAVPKGPYDTSTPSDLLHYFLEMIFCSDSSAVLFGKVIITQGLQDVIYYYIRCHVQPHALEFLHNKRCLSLGFLPVFLDMDRLEHCSYIFGLYFRNKCKDISIKMNYTSRPRSHRNKLSRALHEPASCVGHERLNSFEAPCLEMPQKGEKADRGGSL